MNMIEAHMGEGIIRMDVSRTQLETYLLKTGLWTKLPSEASENTHYTLSPCAYQLSSFQQQELHNLACRTYSALANIHQKLGDIVTNESNTKEDMLFLKLARNATRGLFSPERGAGMPPILKVDLIRRADGMYQIAEVDAYNPRGLAYLALLDGTVPSNMKRYPGVTKFSEMLRNTSEKPWHIVVSQFERYYARAFQILVTSLMKNGVSAKLISDKELHDSPELVKELGNVLIIPESLDAYQDVRSALLEQYVQGNLKLFYPPTAYLGSKAFLPFISEEKRMSKHVPKCSLLSRTLDPIASLKGNLVLKGVMSSGMKKVIFSDLEAERFLTEYRNARSNKNPSWILQEQVEQVPFSVTVFNKNGDEEQQQHFFRLTAYITKDGVLGAEVTGRPDRMIHGAPDCIQIPCVLA